MNWRTRVVVACLTAATVAGSAFAQLSAEYRNWDETAVKWIMTKDEAGQWKRIRTDEEAKAFVDLFWAKRDPSPGTPQNEFRQEFDRRVEFADQQFGQARRKGSLTDRGHILIVLGAPYTIARSNPEGQGTIQTPSFGEDRDTIQNYSPRQLWTYEQARTNIELGQPKAEIAFVDQYASNDWTLERQARTPIDELLKRTVESYVTQPNLTSAPTYQAQAQAQEVPQTAPAPAPAAETGLRTESLVAAVREMKAADANPYKNLSISWAETNSTATPSGKWRTANALMYRSNEKTTFSFGQESMRSYNFVLTWPCHRSLARCWAWLISA